MPTRFFSFPHLERNSHTSLFRYFSFCVAFTFGFVALGLAVYHFMPSTHWHFIHEDGAVETLSAVFYGVATILGVYALFQLRWIAFVTPYVAPVVVSGIAFLDEISWGASEKSRHITVVKGTRIDGFHDYLEVLNTMYLRHSPIFPSWEVPMMLGFVSLTCFGIAIYLRRLYPVLLFAAFAGFMIALGLQFDIAAKFWKHKIGGFLMPVEELTEAAGGLALIFTNAMLLVFHRSPNRIRNEEPVALDSTPSMQRAANFE